MKRQVKRIAIMTTGLSLSLCSMLPPQLSATPATEVNVNINIGPPPPVIVQARPTMIYLREPAVYVAVGVPYDIYFVGGRYYYLHGKDWFWGSGYKGPWTYVEYRSVPPGLQKYKLEKMHEFREREYKDYKSHGAAFKGQHFDADEHHEAKSDHGNSGNSGNNGNNGNNGRGRGNGNKNH